MDRIFTHSSGNGFRQTVGTASTVLTWFFGPFYLAFRGAWAAAFLTFFVGYPVIAGFTLLGAFAGALGGLLFFLMASIGWAVGMQEFIVKSLLSKGYRLET